jgi:hypothetical protein
MQGKEISNYFQAYNMFHPPYNILHDQQKIDLHLLIMFTGNLILEFRKVSTETFFFTQSNFLAQT